MKMKPATLALLAAGGAGLLFFLKKDEVLTLVPGGSYRLVNEAQGTPGTNWKGISDKLKKMGVEDHVIKGKGDTRTLTYTLSPTSSVKMQPGQPLFQVTSGDSVVTVVLSRVEPLGRA